jgi:hypothetical protein
MDCASHVIKHMSHTHFLRVQMTSYDVASFVRETAPRIELREVAEGRVGLERHVVGAQVEFETRS